MHSELRREGLKKRTAEFWDKKPCGSEYAKGLEGKSFFAQTRKHRYETHPFLLEELRKIDGKTVLEVGCGTGTDLCELAKHNKAYGIDLSSQHLRITRARLRAYHRHANIRAGDAENLPYPDNSFDFVLSYGVLHHTPNTQKAVDEILRCLKPGGEAMVMLYHKHSLNMLRIMMQRVPLNDGTDGKGCPLAKVYSSSEAKRLFSGFSEVSTSVRYLDRLSLAYRMMPEFVSRLFGWHLIVRAKK